jgi:hypothetical protein
VQQLKEMREAAARAAARDLESSLAHQTNGDEELYKDQAYAGNFSKTLPHDANGLVVPSAYLAFLNALRAGTQEALDQVPAGGPGKFSSVLGALQFQMEGIDSPSPRSKLVPSSIAGAQSAAEMVELYWENYVSDVPFLHYGSNPLIGQVIEDMSRLSSFDGSRPVTPQNLFRYAFTDADIGPYVSQILYQSHRIDGTDFVPKIHSRLPVSDPETGKVVTGPGTGTDFMTNLPEYVYVENGKGALQPSPSVIDPTPRFIRSVRDLGSLANSDYVFSIYFRAAIILDRLDVDVDANSPYTSAKRISSFNTFSVAWLFSLIGRVHQTDSHAFFQKWYVHRKLRPEAYANLVDGIMGHRFTLDPSLHADVLNSSVLPLIFERNRQLNVKRGLGTAGSFFLPQEMSVGSPVHPSSPSAHAVNAGACVTMIKAVLDVGTPTKPKPWPAPPVIASADGLSLVPTKDNLTILGELNKLAFNICEGRNMSGLHWRVSDNMLGLLMGEEIAIELLKETAATYPEKGFEGFTLTKFDGTTIVVGGNKHLSAKQGSVPSRRQPG